MNTFIKQVFIHLQMSRYRDRCLFTETSFLRQLKYLLQAPEMGCIYLVEGGEMLEGLKTTWQNTEVVKINPNSPFVSSKKLIFAREFHFNNLRGFCAMKRRERKSLSSEILRCVRSINFVTTLFNASGL